ncbi:MAG: hypothetical protein H8E66_14020 [Planctomycetes bacterium]|nr:hypothetical protein [Planctomycetota bacterium]
MSRQAHALLAVFILLPSSPVLTAAELLCPPGQLSVLASVGFNPTLCKQC